MAQDLDAETKPKNLSARSSRILIVDEDRLNMGALAPQLSQRGYSVNLLSSASEALQALRDSQFDIVFTSMSLPDMRGELFCDQVREIVSTQPRLPLIALSQPDVPVEPVEFLRHGIDDYIVKPLTLRQIFRMLRLYAPAAELDVTGEGDQADLEARGESAVLDTVGALEDFSGDIEGYKSLLELLLTSITERMERMGKYLAEGSFTDLARECHNIKSITAGLGAGQFSRLANKMEFACKEGRAASVPALLAELEASAERLSVEIRGFLALNTGKP